MSDKDLIEMVSGLTHKVMIDMEEANEEIVRNALIERGWTPPNKSESSINTIAYMSGYRDAEAKLESILPKWVSVDELPKKHGWYYCRIVGDTENSHDTYYGPMYNDDTKIGWEGKITYWLDNVPPAPEIGE